MKVHYPNLYNMAHLSLNVFTASKGSNNYILIFNIVCLFVVLWSYTVHVFDFKYVLCKQKDLVFM